ncbi:MAG TPA: acetolactate decarboxylase [Kofleriaceae bacterium]|nr:acetolactate decarboxylase [Kofleriaceae bacterium]
MGAPPAAAPPPRPEVRVWGELRAMMHEGRTEARVAIAPLLATPHLYAVGAVAGMRGEITVVDGAAWLALGDRDAGRASPGPGDAGAALLVASHVTDWTRVTIAEDIAFAELDRRIEALAAAAGIDVEQPFAFLIEGRLTDARWHVLAGPPGAGSHDHTEGAVTGEQAALDGTLVGFFSKHHEGVFTHMGQHVHAHLVNPSMKLAAHADRFAIRAGSVLALPR